MTHMSEKENNCFKHKLFKTYMWVISTTRIAVQVRTIIELIL